MENHFTIMRKHTIVLAAICWAIVFCAHAAEPDTNKPARIKVSGFGLLGDREMVRLLRNFQAQTNVLDRAFVEDSALVLFSRMHSLGYLDSRLEATFTRLDGRKVQMSWTNALEVELPRGFAAHEVRFRARGGVRFYYEQLDITGLKGMSEKEAESYFISGGVLLRLKRNRLFTPELLRSSIKALTEALVRKGYRDATVSISDVRSNAMTGKVFVRVAVNEGLPTIVQSVTVQSELSDGTVLTNQLSSHLGEPFSTLWQQDLERQLKEKEFKRGYPDATADTAIAGTTTTPTNILATIFARVRTGPLIHLGKVEFRGNQNTRASVIESRVKLKEGAPLNRLEAEHSRARLARLGVFDSVNLSYTNVDEDTRDVVYDLKETKPFTFSLLGGYGSYEMWRGGFEMEHRNVFGMAHDIRLRAVQSLKASYGDLQYTVPEVFGENVDAFIKGDGLRREEVSFTREEYIASTGIHRRLAAIQTDLSVHYDYQFLHSVDQHAITNNVGSQNAEAASFFIDMTRDRRDNPLLPTRGYRLFSSVEIASSALGGNVDYLRVILSGSYHFDLGGGRLIHLGATHGLSLTPFGGSKEFPFNKRFFPGGQDSLRGYQEGEASPLDAQGNQLGAETYTQGNFEFEQVLTHAWSVVAFFDAVGMAKDRANYPWNEELFSVGGGLRWRTLIGPVRLEYGYNLNPRPHDPMGTIQFSIGFPF
jgi:outer membrane protein insertion porin family